MKNLLACALMCFSMVATAAELYRWTDPESGKIMMTPIPPPYPIKEKQEGGSLPNGQVIRVIFDENAPQYKAAVAKRQAAEMEQKRLAEEKVKAQAAKEEEQRRREEEAKIKRMEAERRAQQNKEEELAAIEKKKKETCNNFGQAIEQVVSAKRDGMSQQKADEIARRTTASEEIIDMLVNMNKAIYANNWKADEAKTNIIVSCKLSTGLPTFSEFYAEHQQRRAENISRLFDIEKKCAKIKEFAGGSYQIEQTCRNQEREAQSTLMGMSIPTEIEKHCTEIGAYADGSYQIMLTCVEQETKAKANLR